MSPDRTPRGPDPVIRMILINWVAGACMGAAFAAVLLAADVAGIGGLIMGDSVSIPALALLFGGFSITFAGVIAATAIMLMNDRDVVDSGGGPGSRKPLAPAPIAVRRRR
jgi:hypothetical protein